MTTADMESLTRRLTHDRAVALGWSKPDCDVDDQQLTEIVRPHTDEETPTAEQVARVVAGIPAIGKACEALSRAGWRASIAGNRITVNEEVAAQFVCAGIDSTGGADPTWVIYGISGARPVWVVGAERQPW